MPISAITEQEAQSVLRRFEHNYRSGRSWKVTFLERYSENGHISRAESGVAYFRRPGKMRWEYKAPEANLFLVDGKTAWFYVPADHTVTRVPARQSTDWRTPFALLAGEMKLSRLCAHWKLVPQEGARKSDHLLFSCKVRDTGTKSVSAPDSGPPPDPVIVSLEIERNSAELARVVVVDPGGVRIEFEFTDWQLDPPMDESLFHFSPPLGVAIVDGFAQQK